MEQNLKIIIDQAAVDRYNKKYFEDHPRARKPKIKAPQHPSLNEYYKGNFQSSNNLKQAWKEFVIWRLRELGLDNYRIDQCDVKYNTYFKTDRRHDIDNISPKFIFDGFVEAGLIVDDDYHHINSLTICCGIDKENPRMEFLISNIRRK